jgi:hypothetical protein
MTWMAWYFGAAFVALGLAGFGIVTYRAVMGRSTPAELLTAAVGGTVGLLYWWSPSIFADQLWATRRFVPVVYPAVVILAVTALVRVPALLGRLRLPGGRVVAAVLAAAMVLSAASATWPIRWGRTQTGHLVAVEELCRRIGPDAAVLVVGRGGERVGPAVRSWCGVPVAFVAGIDRAEQARQAARWGDAGRALWVVADGRDELADVTGAAPGWSSTVVLADDQIEATLTRPPRAYAAPEPFRLWASPVEP